MLTLSPSGLSEGVESDDMVAGFVDILKRLPRDPSAHLLFDNVVASLVRSLVNEGHIEPNRLALTHADQAAVGSGLVARLPASLNAHLSEVLDRRRDLDDPLSRCRRAVAGMADRLAFRTFDPEFSVEIDDLWHADRGRPRASWQGSARRSASPSRCPGVLQPRYGAAPSLAG